MNGKASQFRQTILPFGMGFFAGIAPFLGLVQALTGIGALVLYIPQSLMGEARILTALLTGTSMLILRSRSFVAMPWMRRSLHGLVLASPLALLLLIVFHQKGLLLRLGTEGGRVVFSEIISSQRIESCRCINRDDVKCVRDELTFDPDHVEECWGRGRVRANRLVWLVSYLVSVAGFESFLVLILQRRWPAESLETSQAAVGGDAGVSAGSGQDLAFLSYTHEDGSLAERLAADLRREGIRTWLDTKNLRGEQSLPNEISAVLAACRWCIVLVSDHIQNPGWVLQEIGWAKSQEIQRGRPTLVPLLLAPDARIPESLADKPWIDFSDYENGLEILLRRLRRSAADID